MELKRLEDKSLIVEISTEKSQEVNGVVTDVLVVRHKQYDNYGIESENVAYLLKSELEQEKENLENQLNEVNYKLSKFN